LVDLSSNLSGANPDRYSLQYDAPYTATDSTLTIVQTTPYDAFDKTVGWTVIVGDYVLVTSKDAAIAPRPAVGASTPPAHSARDPRCPGSVPAANAPCNPGTGQPLECEYGGDAYGQCTTTAQCALQGDGAFAFQFEQNDIKCGSNDPSCPASYKDVPMNGAGFVTPGYIYDGGACAAASTITCGYPEAVCVCTQPASSTKCSCRLRTDVFAEDGKGACPARRPLAGDSCATEGMWCIYDGICGAISLGISMACQGGYWEPHVAGASCPARQGC
jgi:hypothetical protein